MVDLYYNIKKFSSGENKILFVVGLPESGKTDLIKSVFKSNDETIQVINTNDLYNLWTFENSIENQGELVSSFYENMIKWIFPVEHSALMREAIITRDRYKIQVLELFIRWCKLHETNSRVIIESTDLLTYNIDPSLIEAYGFSLIVLGANVYKCAKHYASYRTEKRFKKLRLMLRYIINTDLRKVRGLHDYQTFCLDHDMINVKL